MISIQVLNQLRGRVLPFVDIVLCLHLQQVIQLTELPIQSHTAINHLYIAVRIPPAEPSADFATNPVLASEVLVPWGNGGISVPPSTSLLTKQCSVNKILLPFLAACPTHINCFSSAPPREFQKSQAIQEYAYFLFYSFICH